MRLAVAIALLVAVAPLAWGATVDWAWSGLLAAVSLLSTGWAVMVLSRRLRPWHPTAGLLAMCSPFLLALVWIAVQSWAGVPQDLHHPLWRAATSSLELPYAGAISLDPFAGQSGLARLAGYALLFGLTLQVARNRSAAWFLVEVVGGVAALYSLYGLVVTLLGLDSILWFEKVRFREAVTATFFNKNSFATFAGLGALCLVAVLWQRMSTAVASAVTRRDVLSAVLGTMSGRGGVHVVAVFIVLVALFLSQSRAGAVATLLALGVLTVTLFHGPGLRRGLLLAVSALAAVLALALIIGGDPLGERLASTELDWSIRLEVYGIALRAIGDSPFLGTGLGTFESVARFYGAPHPTLNLAHAHSTYLELAVELGLPGAVLLILTPLCLTVNALLGVFRRQRDTALPALGGAAGVLVGVHSLVDFSAQIPAVALVWTVLLAIGTAQSWSSRY